MNELVDLGALYPQLVHLDRPADGFTPGFCQAIGSCFGIDPLLIRILFILAPALSGMEVIAYVWGILLTPRAGRQTPIHRLPPVFTSQSLRTQWTVIALSSTLVVAAVSQMLSSLSSVLLLSPFALVLYSCQREPCRWPAPPTDPLPDQEQPTIRTDPQPPVVDLYAPEAPEPQSPERVRCPWLGTGLVLFVSYLVATGVIVLGLLNNPLLSPPIVLGAVGVMVLGWGLLVRSCRLPVVLLLLVVTFAGTTVALSASKVERTINPVEVNPGRECLNYQFTTFDGGVVDLRYLSVNSSMLVHMQTVMSEARIMLPRPSTRNYVRVWATDVSWPGGTVPRDRDSAVQGIRLFIDGYLSNVKVEYPS